MSSRAVGYAVIAACCLGLACLPPKGYPPAPDAPAPASPAVGSAPSLVAATHALVREARRLRDVPYQVDGRMEPPRFSDIDCMGLVFVPFERTYGTPWRRHSPMPTELIARSTLGRPVEGLLGVVHDVIDYELLRQGDVVFLLGYDENPKEPALTKLDGRDAWVWHMGLYTGGPDRAFIHADPFYGSVSEVSLDDYLANFWVSYEGIYVVRPPASP